jgi:hypothetical protein
VNVNAKEDRSEVSGGSKLMELTKEQRQIQKTR